MRLQMRGRRMAFSLGTGNAEAAARKAANVYTDFLTLGVEGALAKYRPQKTADGITTVAYSYIGPQLTWAIYRNGTIGRANANGLKKYPAGMLLVDRASIIIVQSPRFHGAVEYIAPGRTGTHTGPPSLSGRRGLSGAPDADARAARFDFLNFDDGDYLTGNRYVQEGLTRASLAWAFTSTRFCRSPCPR